MADAFIFHTFWFFCQLNGHQKILESLVVEQAAADWFTYGDFSSADESYYSMDLQIRLFR
mgnify:CR=1 FL=1